MNKKGWKIATGEDLEATYRFFYEFRDATNPPFSTYPHGIRGTLEVLLSDGKLLIAEDETDGETNVVGLLGYFHGTPHLESDGSFTYRDREIGYVYCFVIAPEHRHPYSYQAVPFLAKCLLEDGHEEARFRTYRDNNDLINKLYRKHGTFVREETNIQGAKANLYSANVRNWMERFGYYEKTGQNA